MEEQRKLEQAGKGQDAGVQIAGAQGQDTGARVVGAQQDAGAAGDAEDSRQAVSETWAEETIADLDDFIESQGIYIRQ